MKAVDDLETLISITAFQKLLKLGPICQERIGELQDGAEEFILNAAHKEKVIENS